MIQVIIGLTYSGLFSLWMLMFICLLLNYIKFKNLLRPIHLYLIFNIYMKSMHCLFLSLTILTPADFFQLSACSSLVIFFTTELSLYLLLSQGYFITNYMSSKKIAIQISYLSVSYFIYTFYFIIPSYFSYTLSLYLLLIYIKSSRNLAKTKQILQQLLGAVTQRNIREGIIFVEQSESKLEYTRFKDVYIPAHLALVLLFELIRTDDMFWYTCICIFESLVLMIKMLMAQKFYITGVERSISFLNDINLGDRPEIFRATIEGSMNSQAADNTLVVTPANSEVFIGTLITEYSFYI
jgi:hypothetical protein